MILSLLAVEIGIFKILQIYYLVLPLDERIHQNLKNRCASQFKRHLPQYCIDDQPWSCPVEESPDTIKLLFYEVPSPAYRVAAIVGRAGKW